MTKTKMLDFIESTGMVINFDRKYLMKKSKEYIKGLYDSAVIYAAKRGLTNKPLCDTITLEKQRRC